MLSGTDRKNALFTCMTKVRSFKYFKDLRLKHIVMSQGLSRLHFITKIDNFGDKMKALVIQVKSAFFQSVPDSMKIQAAKYLNQIEY